MTLMEWFKLKRGNFTKMALDLKISKQHLHNIAKGKYEPDAALAVQIEIYTQGKVSRYLLISNAPAIWGPVSP